MEPPNVKDEPRPQRAPEAALQPKCPMWSLALATGSAKRTPESTATNQSPGQSGEVEAILLRACRSGFELRQSSARVAAQLRECAAGIELQNASAWEV